ncbi:hypothetical protein PISMIDRAFT_10423 [Pisolithus microcarpus 441]|uniref:Uncharacterized protein n=1 Tax=Pisolithus microcarpus 441 TaxID=765257 RepID=A0A0C9ZE02_9AGAM|nr:hypothetical protein PISMIDRAFT_10423 [Pisolithus microcarpus 441]
MPQATSISKLLADHTADLHTRVLCSHRIPSSQCALAATWANKCVDGRSADLEQSTLGGTIKRPKLQPLVEPPKGWEEHMFGLRDRRCSLTPLTSSTRTLHLPTPSVPQQDQTHDENTEVEGQQESTDNEDGLKSSSEEGSKGSNYCGSEENSSDCKESSSDPEEGVNTRAPSVQKISGIQSPLPLSSPPADQFDYSGLDVEETMPSLIKAIRSTRHFKKGRVKKPGNLSKEVLEEIQAFAKDVKMTTQELGQWHGQSTRNILVAAGFGVKPSHTKVSEANLFHSWYWATQPKPDGVDRDAINSLITREYNSYARHPKGRPFHKSIAARVENAKTQFSGLAEAWSNLEDIEIIGTVMYIRQDPAGCQMSGIFGGSEVIRNFINENGIDVWALLDKYTVIFKCLRNGDGIEAGLIHTGSTGDLGMALDLCCCLKETVRDRNCRVFGSMMKEKLLAALRELCLTHGIEVGNPQKVAWHRLLELMWKYHITVVNWPHGVSPPGPGFDHKQLKAGPLRQLVVPYLRRKLGLMYDGQTDNEEEQDSLDDAPEIEIRCWNQDIINISDENPLKGEVPLVKAADGTILRKISDDPEWQKSRQERDRRQQDTEVRQQCQLPFPSRKRPCVEVSNDDNDDTAPQPAQSGHQGLLRDEGLGTGPIMQDSCRDPPIVPSGVHTRELGPSDLPALAPRYRVCLCFYASDDKANGHAV